MFFGNILISVPESRLRVNVGREGFNRAKNLLKPSKPDISTGELN
jgi:hypothetical protein